MAELSIEDAPVVLATEAASTTADAQREVERWAEPDPVYGELMATYVALGELLEANRHITPATAESLPLAEVQQFEEECRALADRLVELEKPMQLDQAQRWARWCARNMKGAEN